MAMTDLEKNKCTFLRISATSYFVVTAEHEGSIRNGVFFHNTKYIYLVGIFLLFMKLVVSVTRSMSVSVEAKVLLALEKMC